MGDTRRALITGTSAGLGRAIAVALAREGYDLALTELDTAMLKDTLAEPALANRKAVPLTLDLRFHTSIAVANAIAPTTVMTESRQQMLADPDKRAAALARIPSGKFTTTEEFAAAVVYLASPGAASVTGHTLPVDGGLMAV